MQTAAVVGGGLSGLAAAISLADHGYQVTLVERESSLGGRLSSLSDPRTGAPIDRWPPFWVDGGRELGRLLEKAGGRDLVESADSADLSLLSRSRIGVLKQRWPRGVLGNVLSVSRLSSVTWPDRLRAVAGVIALCCGRRAIPDSLSFYRHLRQIGQGNRIIGSFWNPLCLLTTGLLVEDISAPLAVARFRSAFEQSAGTIGVAHSRVGLSRLLESRIAGFIRAREGRLSVSRTVQRVLIVDGEVRGLEIQDAGVLRADAYVLAVPPRDLLSMLPEQWAGHPHFAAVRPLGYRPLTAVHLFFDRQVLPWKLAISAEPEGGLLTARGLTASGSGANPGHVAAFFPNSPGTFDLTREELVERTRRFLVDFVPGARDARLRHSLVISHEHAVFLASPGSQRARLGCETPVKNLWLAGSWTDTGLPGGLEGSAKSGRLAAESLDLSFRHGAKLACCLRTCRTSVRPSPRPTPLRPTG